MRVLQLFVFMLAAFTGYVAVSRVPSLFHMSLLAAISAISGISLVGSLLLAGARYGGLATTLGVIAVACATTTIVGGFLIVNRTLRMFKQAGGTTAAGERRDGSGRRVSDLLS